MISRLCWMSAAVRGSRSFCADARTGRSSFDLEAGSGRWALELWQEDYCAGEAWAKAYAEGSRLDSKLSHVSQQSKEWRAAKGVECASQECYPPALAPTLQLKQSFRQIHGLMSSPPAPA